MRDDFQSRMPIEDSRKDQPRHRHARLVGPSERPPDLVQRLRLAGVVGDVGAAKRVQPHRQVEGRHAIEQRQVFRAIERLAVDVREHLDAARAKVAHRAFGLAHRRIHVAERQRRDKPRKTVRVFTDQRRHAVVGGARQVDTVLAA